MSCANIAASSSGPGATPTVPIDWVRPTDWHVAKKIMRRNFLGSKVVAVDCGMPLSSAEICKATQVPFSSATLTRCALTHILFLALPHDGHGSPLTLVRLLEIASPSYASLEGQWCTGEDFANSVTLPFGWYLVRANVLDDSRKLTFEEQQRLLRPNEYRGSALLYAYLMFLSSRAHRIILDTELAWCEDLSSSGCHVMAGGNDSRGPKVLQGWRDDTRHDHVGLAPAIKPDFLIVQ